MPARPMTIFYEVDLNETGEFRGTIDVSQSVSMIARKKYRQGLEWAIAGIRVNSPQAVKMTVSVLPQTWSCAQAWKTSFRAWRKMRRNAEAGMTVDNEAAYADFKVFFDDKHVDPLAVGGAPNLIPYGTTPAAPDATYEWLGSEFTWPDDSDMVGATRLAHMIGDDHSNVSFGMIHNYANLRARPQEEDPNIPDAGRGSVFTSLFDYGGDADPVLGDIASENDKPPYYIGVDQSTEEYYPGGKNYRPSYFDWNIGVTNIYNSGAGSNSNGFMPGFTAYCGLIRVVLEGSPAGDNIGLYLDLMPGPHDGYMARPMQEVN